MLFSAASVLILVYFAAILGKNSLGEGKEGAGFALATIIVSPGFW